MDGSDLEFDWDEANIDHIARHGVTKEEAEEACMGPTVELGVDIVGDEERWLQVGSTARGRILLVVTTWRGHRLRVVTAVEAIKRLANVYYQAFGN